MVLRLRSQCIVLDTINKKMAYHTACNHHANHYRLQWFNSPRFQNMYTKVHASHA